MEAVLQEEVWRSKTYEQVAYMKGQRDMLRRLQRIREIVDHDIDELKRAREEQKNVQ